MRHQDSQPPAPQPWSLIATRTVLSTLGRVGCLTLFIALAALALGLLLDNLLGTRPWLTILLFVGSLPVTSYIIYRVVLSSTAHLRKKPDLESGNKEEPPRE